jgi:hypothetical protein
MGTAYPSRTRFPPSCAQLCRFMGRKACRKRAFSIYGFGTQSIYDPLIAACTAARTMNAIVIEGRRLSGSGRTVCHRRASAKTAPGREGPRCRSPPMTDPLGASNHQRPLPTTRMAGVSHSGPHHRRAWRLLLQDQDTNSGAPSQAAPPDHRQWPVHQGGRLQELHGRLKQASTMLDRAPRRSRTGGSCRGPGRLPEGRISWSRSTAAGMRRPRWAGRRRPLRQAGRGLQKGRHHLLQIAAPPRWIASISWRAVTPTASPALLQETPPILSFAPLVLCCSPKQPAPATAPTSPPRGGDAPFAY